MSLKNSNNNIGNRNRDLPVCSVVPAQTYINSISTALGFYFVTRTVFHLSSQKISIIAN